ncbi:MAG: hypothetical protein M8862_03405, partial [marine benthic group bacterium]|nr:hypothetical protein [Gemmatimonadota bacterium]
MSRLATLCLVTATLSLAGCGGSDDGSTSSEWTGTSVDSAGIQLVTNTLTPIWNEGVTWSLEEVLTIGAAEGDPEYQFGQISGVGITSDGRVVVSDMQGQHVKVFGSDGTWQRTFGEAGSGPGQFGQQAGPVL